MKIKNSDVLILGGGLTGLCLASVLSNLDLQMILIDQHKITSKHHTKKDLRTVAISYGTKLFLEKHGIWNDLKKEVQPIETIKVLNRNIDSNILFDNLHNNDAMGYIIRHSIFKDKLIKRIRSCNNIKIYQNTTIKNLLQEENNVAVIIEEKIKILSKLLIASDGKNSFIQSFCNLTKHKINYDQSALVLNFQHSKNHNNTAYEIFLPNGPLATLPVKTNKKRIFTSSLIWSENKEFINHLQNLSKSFIKDVIEEKTFPYLGKIISIENIKVFNLNAHICQKFYDKRIVLVGDSAHSIHPIAGQGWNLGIRDVKYIYDLIKEHSQIGIDIGSKSILRKYNDARFTDVFSMLCITHGLNKIFSNKYIITNQLRSLGFSYINNNRKLTKQFVNYAMGINL